jgi:hypothetical protein
MVSCVRPDNQNLIRSRDMGFYLFIYMCNIVIKKSVINTGISLYNKVPDQIKLREILIYLKRT